MIFNGNPIDLYDVHILRTTKVLNISWQVWAKNVTNDSVAVLLVNAGDVAQPVSVSFDNLIPCMTETCHTSPMGDLCFQCKKRTAEHNVSRAVGGAALAATDLWSGKTLPLVQPGGTLTVQLDPHDSAFVLLAPSSDYT